MISFKHYYFAAGKLAESSFDGINDSVSTRTAAVIETVKIIDGKFVCSKTINREVLIVDVATLLLLCTITLYPDAKFSVFWLYVIKK